MALARSEPLDLSEDEGFDAAERLGAWDALAAWATAGKLREAAVYLSARQARVRQCSRDLEDQRLAVAMELAAYTRVAPRTGEHHVEHAVALTERLPRTLEALEAGRISYSHARVVIDQTARCDEAMARRVDVELWNRPARERTPTQLRDTARRIVARLDPEHIRRRADQAVRERSVRYWSDDDGATGVVQLRLPAPEARGVYAVVDHLARTAGDHPDAEHRTLDNKRADVLRDLVLDGALGDVPSGGPAAVPTEVGLRTGQPDDVTPERPVTDEAASEPPIPTDDAGADGDTRRCEWPSPVRTEIRVTIPWSTLAGLSDEPADLEGHGPVPAPQARAMAYGFDATWLRMLTDPVTGTAVHLDRRRYRPPRRLAEFVRARDRTCAAPGCRVPAARCDLDHVLPYDHTVEGGGPGRTVGHNLKPGCRRHHRVKTHGGWRCDMIPDTAGGHAPALQWTAPSGRTWLVRAPELDEPDLGTVEEGVMSDAA